MISVLVTTQHKGVFFGYLAELPESIASVGGELLLNDARNCIYWSTAERGVFGLAVTGPGPSCRVGPKVPELRINAITSVARCTPEAAKQWEAGSWN
jgi:hypothetical protein